MIPAALESGTRKEKYASLLSSMTNLELDAAVIDPALPSHICTVLLSGAGAEADSPIVKPLVCICATPVAEPNINSPAGANVMLPSTVNVRWATAASSSTVVIVVAP